MTDLTGLDPTQDVPAAFDAHAENYDDVALSALGRVYRDRVRRHLSPSLAPGSRVLDLGCGTGLDAVWMAEHGCTVVGLDASEAMLEHATDRARGAGLSAACRFVQADLNALGECGFDDLQFDLVLANFGAINCVGALAQFGSELGRAVRPGGRAVLVPMSPMSPTERLQALLTGNKTLWSRRRSIDLRHRSDVPGYEGLVVQYFSAQAVGTALSPWFAEIGIEALGVVLPTFEQRALVEHRPALLSTLRRLDLLLSPLAVRLSMGDHQVVVLERKMEGSAP